MGSLGSSQTHVWGDSRQRTCAHLDAGRGVDEGLERTDRVATPLTSPCEGVGVWVLEWERVPSLFGWQLPDQQDESDQPEYSHGVGEPGRIGPSEQTNHAVYQQGDEACDRAHRRGLFH